MMDKSAEDIRNTPQINPLKHSISKIALYVNFLAKYCLKMKTYDVVGR